MPPEVQQPKEDRSLGELFAELTRETATLVRQGHRAAAGVPVACACSAIPWPMGAVFSSG